MKISTSIRLCLPAAVLAALTSFPAHAPAQATTPAAPAAAPAATPPAGMPISIPVTVVDKKGDPVKNLTAADVTLADNGHIQAIQSFLPAQPSPVTFGLLAQTSTNLRGELGDERLASVHFVDHTLPGTDDKFFVIQFAREVDLLEDPTGTASKLHDSITQLGSRQFGNQNSSSDSSDQSSGDSHATGGGGGTLYDAIYLASNEILKKQPGQHVIVLITDGIDRDSKETVNDAIEAAQAAHAAIFAIYYKGEEERTNNPNQNNGRHGGTGGSGYPGGGGGYPGGGGGYPGGGGGGGRRGGQAPSEQPHVDGKEILEHICSATGGYMVEGKRDKADESFAKLTALLKNQYTLSWTPDKDAANSVSHHLTLTTKKAEIWPLVQQDYSTTQ